jgi:hypothetical protein
MASTYSDLKIELIGTGDQTGTWGLTTNNNFQFAVEEAITGSADVTFADADQVLTLTNTNTSQTARNLRLNLIGSVSAARNLTVPAIKKFYIVNNNLTYNITVKCAGGVDTGVIVPAGTATFLFNVGTYMVNAISYLSTLYLGVPLGVASGGTGSSLSTGAPFALKGANSDITSIGGLTSPLSVAQGGTGVSTGTGSGSVVLSNTPVLAGTPTAPTATAGTNNTQLATTAFVTTAVSTATGSLGTMSTQNANAVAITGGTITGITDLAVADGGTGSSTLTLNNVLLGNGTSALQTVAPGTSGNLLTSNGTTWQSTTKTLTYGTSVPTTSGASVTLSSIPSWAKRITIIWNGVTNSASTGLLMTLNSISTGYSGTQSRLNATGTVTNNSSTSGFTLTQNPPSTSYGKYTITLANASTYFYVVDGAQNVGTNTNFIVGGVSVGSVLTSVTFAGGTFSAGEIAIIYE